MRNPGEWLAALAHELTIAAADPDVWRALAAAVLIGGIYFILGAAIALRVGLMPAKATVVDWIGVGLGTGLVVGASWWAAVGSMGRSSFTPVAIAFAAALVWNMASVESPRRLGSLPARTRSLAANLADNRHRAAAGALLSIAFIAAVAFLYGSTTVLSPRDGLQPVEFLDEAFYSVLGRDLAQTGTETIYSPSGFEALPGIPAQTWYHWGEIWLSAAGISVLGISALDARHFVVLPLLLLACAALSGSLVRRLTSVTGSGPVIFGGACCLFLATIPLPGPYFASWPRGLIFGITMYGLAAVVALLLMFVLATRRPRTSTVGGALFVGTLAATMIPSHLVLAVLGLTGTAAVAVWWAGDSLIRWRRIPSPSPTARSTLAVAAILAVVTVAWGLLTGHGIGTSGVSSSVEPFNESWRVSLVSNALGGIPFLAIPAALLVVRRQSVAAWIMVGTLAILLAGSVVWGARLADFTSFHAFYGGLAVFGTPAAATAVLIAWRALRRARLHVVASVTLVATLVWVEVGFVTAVLRLQQFGPHDYEPVPVAMLETIESLPRDAKIAYSCNPHEELAFWNSRLISLDAHTGRRVVPMCFQAEYFPILTGTAVSPDVASPLFTHAPQRVLYPTSDSSPTEAEIATFMRDHGIAYILEDVQHPNRLVPSATTVAEVAEIRLLRLP